MKLIETISFVVPGRPVPKPRPRMSRHGHVYTPSNGHAFERLVATSFLEHGGSRSHLEGPIELKLGFRYKTPKRLSHMDPNVDNPRDITPDIDNLLKSFMDGLNTVAFKDDRQVFRVSMDQLYGTQDYTSVEVKYYE